MINNHEMINKNKKETYKSVITAVDLIVSNKSGSYIKAMAMTSG